MSNSTTNLDLVSQSQAGKEVTINAALDAASPAMLYGRQARTTAGLTWGYYGGTVLVAGTPTTLANGTVGLTPSSMNYVEANPATGAVSVNTTGFTAGYKQLYSITAGASSVISYTDLRTLGGAGGGVSSVNGKGGIVVLDAADVGADPGGTAADTMMAHLTDINPHPEYLTQTEGDARYATSGDGTSAIGAHVAESDPHTQYQKEAEKGAANGYASLDSDGKVPSAQLPAAGSVSSITGTTGAAGGNATVTGGTSTTSGNAGGQATIVGGTNSSNTGPGGAASLKGGAGGSTSGAGGAATVSGGNAQAGGQTGGAANLLGGDGSGTGAGGAVTVGGGSTGSGGTAGAALFRGGDGSAGGNAVFRGGNATSSGQNPGTATLKGGSAGGNNVGADAIVEGGDAAGGFTNNQGGHAKLRGGPGNGTAPRGNIVLDGGAGAALPTTATGGFVYLPTCAGTPSGTPLVSHAGTIPFVYDTTNKILYTYVGSTWINVASGLAGGQPFDVHTFYPGVPGASAKLYRGKLARAVTFPTNFAGAQFTASVNATGSAVFDIQKNGTSVGSCTIASGSTTATFTSTGGAAVSFAAGDVFSVVAPATADATLTDPAITFAGTR